MNRRGFIGGAAAAAGLASGLGGAWAGPERPNVLLVLVDSMRAALLTPGLRAPNLDRLARSGVSFNNHFVAATPCSPSRACLLTGTYTTQNGMYLNCDFTEGDRQPSLNTRLPILDL